MSKVKLIGVNLNKVQYFKTKDGNFQNIDASGNHFINGKCANPKATDMVVNDETGLLERKKIGSTYPDASEIEV